MTGKLTNLALTFAILLFSLALPFSQVWAAGDDLTADELARALEVTWATIILPGTENDSYSIGPILELGDGSKPVTGGMVGLVPGGTKVKFFVRKVDRQYHCSIVSADGKASHSKLNILFEEAGNTMSSGGTLKYEKHLYIIKGARDNSSIQSDTPLKPNEFGVRLTITKAEEDKAETETP